MTMGLETPGLMYLKTTGIAGSFCRPALLAPPSQSWLDRTFHRRLAQRPRAVLCEHEGAPRTWLRNSVCAELQEPQRGHHGAGHRPFAPVRRFGDLLLAQPHGPRQCFE